MSEFHFAAEAMAEQQIRERFANQRYKRAPRRRQLRRARREGKTPPLPRD